MTASRRRAATQPQPQVGPRGRSTVSVVIPVKDDAAALERCLRLLDRQQLRALEVVVVDNASSDSSAEVAEKYGARVVFEPAPGIPAAAAAGYRAAKGDIIARCDADSTPPPGWLADIVAALDGRPDVHAVTGSGTFYDVPWVLGRLAAWVYLGLYYVLVTAALGHPPLWGSNMAMRRETWERVAHAVHLDDPELHDDIDLSFAVGASATIRIERRLRVGVSGRSLRGVGQLRRRVRRANRTLRVNWATSPPSRRWAARLRLGGHGTAAGQ